ncbi:MAG: hypothetical protein KDJ38_05900 [Gammaproteobacteria bacterium]|nr:hypothetical protein [Gammaproteobacteria bacterium]
MKRLSGKNRAVLRQTHGLLNDNSEDITYRSYDLLFTRHPRLRPLFPEARVHHPQIFQIALQACSRMVINGGDLADFEFRRIAAKHCILGMESSLRPLLHKYLLEAMEDVLFDDATEDMLAAWSLVFKCVFDHLGIMEGNGTQSGLRLAKVDTC